MAAIHPSRMSLIKPELRESRSHEYDGPRERPRERSRTPPRRRERSRSRERQRSRSQERRKPRSHSRDRRHSPDYGEYKKPAYPPREDIPRHGGGGNIDWMEKRRIQRENASADPWPPSPKEPSRPLLPKSGKRSKRDKRARSLSSSGSDSSSDEGRRRRKRKKEKKRSRKEKDRDDRRDRRERSRSKSRRYHEDSEEEDSRRQRRSGRTRSRSKSHRTPSEEEDWVEKPAMDVLPQGGPSNIPDVPDSDSDDEVGPQPAGPSKARKLEERAYGNSLLRGEGSAMAAFLQGEDGTDARIPRRGEIGLTSDEIAQYEDAGYVMSGNRHHRMNAVRMRKENQVISAEEKRQMLTLQKEEKERREAILREEFSDLVTENLKKVGGSAVAPTDK